MIILTTKGWSDYELIDSGKGQRLEKFGKFVLQRSDPQAIWQPRLKNWQADFIFQKTDKDNGKWIGKNLSQDWQVKYKDLTFIARLTPFKHTGIFPEQSLQWDFIQEKIKNAGREVKVLNLFGYTGGASLAASLAGARVTHVDASRSAIGWAKENQQASNLPDNIRWILDDCLKFVEKEIRRGNKYDALIMDPPIYGHGPSGEVWDFNKSFPTLLQNCKQLLSDNPLFILINAYAISASSLMLENLLKDLMLGGTIEVGELALQEKKSDRLLSTGIFARWW